MTNDSCVALTHNRLNFMAGLSKHLLNNMLHIVYPTPWHSVRREKVLLLHLYAMSIQFSLAFSLKIVVLGLWG